MRLRQCLHSAVDLFELKDQGSLIAIADSSLRQRSRVWAVAGVNLAKLRMVTCILAINGLAADRDRSLLDTAPELGPSRCPQSCDPCRHVVFEMPCSTWDNRKSDRLRVVLSYSDILHVRSCGGCFKANSVAFRHAAGGPYSYRILPRTLTITFYLITLHCTKGLDC